MTFVLVLKLVPHLQRKNRKMLLLLYVAIIMASTGAIIQVVLSFWVSYASLMLIAAEIPGFFVGVGLIKFFLQNRNVISINEIGFRTTDITRTVLIGVVVGAMLGFSLLSLEHVDFIHTNTNHDITILEVFASCCVAPFFEELLFRGLLFNFFVRFFGLFQLAYCQPVKEHGIVVLAAVVSSAMFTFSHLRIPEVLAWIFICSLVFTWLYRNTRSLLGSIVAHAVYNFIVIVY